MHHASFKVNLIGHTNRPRIVQYEPGGFKRLTSKVILGQIRIHVPAARSLVMV